MTEHVHSVLNVPQVSPTVVRPPGISSGGGQSGRLMTKLIVRRILSLAAGIGAVSDGPANRAPFPALQQTVSQARHFTAVIAPLQNGNLWVLLRVLKFELDLELSASGIQQNYVKRKHKTGIYKNITKGGRTDDEETNVAHGSVSFANRLVLRCWCFAQNEINNSITYLSKILAVRLTSCFSTSTDTGSPRYAKGVSVPSPTCIRRSVSVKSFTRR